MKTYISLLRGINVSGKNIIKMNALCAMFESLKFLNVKTYIQSGNIVFMYKETTTHDLEKKISAQIKKEFGFEVPVMVKESEELNAIFTQNPFINKRDEDIAKLHVTFLSQEPNKITIDKIMEGNYADDEFMINGKVVYLFCPNGYGNTKLTNTFFENKFKATATTRNWKTITELVTISDQIQNKN